MQQQQLFCPPIEEFFDNFELQEQIGSGLTSKVFKCRNLKSEEIYAAKVAPLCKQQSCIDNPTRLEMYREIEILKTLQGHPNIIELFGCFESNDQIIVVMEFCPNGDLTTLLNNGPETVNEVNAKMFMHQVFSAMEHVHSNGIIHRDIKLDNLLLDRNFQVKMIDFGFAVNVSKSDPIVLKEFLGTVRYMSPEMIANERLVFSERRLIGPEHDMWSCGVVLYLMLSGLFPFHNSRMVKVKQRILAGDYSLDSFEWKDISEEAKDLVINLLRMNLNLRLNVHSVLKEHPFFNS